MIEADLHARRVDRLRHELLDEGVALPADDAVTALLLEELDYARHPLAHEGVAPRFGAMLSAQRPVLATVAGSTERIECADDDVDIVRRMADGRSSFMARSTSGTPELICFDHSFEYESSAVHLAADSGAVVLQRLPRGWVRICSDAGVATWDGLRWWSTPASADVAAAIHAQVPTADGRVLGHLVEFCLHWLSAGRVGAVLVWSLDRDPHTIEHLGHAAAVHIPPLEITCREHYSPLLNALAQFDRGALVDPSGRIETLGVALRPGRESLQLVAPYRGTRHTSAVRFSHAEPGELVFVVSAGGPLSVFHQGRRLDT